MANSLVIGLGLGMGTLLVLCGTNVLLSVLRQAIPQAIRLPAIMLIIAAWVTAAELVCKALLFDWYLAAGIFLPLIIANCSILARAEFFASRQPVTAALMDGLRHGAGFALLLIVAGGLRQWLGAGFTLALAPAGGFFALALLVAARNAVAAR